MALAQAISPFLWKGNQAVTKEQLDRQRKLTDALRAPEGYTPKGIWSLAGGLAGEGAATYRDYQSDQTEAEKQKVISDALARGDYETAMASDFATPQQSAIASALMGRDWQAQDRDEQRAYDEPLRSLQIEQAQLDLEQDRNPTPEPADPPRIEERWNPETQQNEKVQWDSGVGDWVPFGIAAPDGPLVTVNNGGADDEFYKAGAKSRGEMFADLETTGIEAQSRIGQVNQLENLLSTAPQGFEGAVKQFAGELGINTEGLSDIQGATAVINKMVPTQRTPGSGTMSDADLALFKASLPRIINQPEGNALIIQTLKGIAVYDQKIGEIATAVLNKEMTPAEGREAMKAVPNPLEIFRKGGGSASDPGNVPEGMDPLEWENMTPEDRALWN